jgi:uncharacterized lipoprotein YmbA
MTHRFTDRLRVFLSAATFSTAILALAACSHSPDTVFYTLEPHDPASGARDDAYRGPAIQVDSVRLPAVLDRPELIRSTGPNTMEVDDFARWAAPVGEMAQRVLTQDLAARLPNDAVVYPGAPKPAATAALTVDVLDFEVSEGRATLDVNWVLTPASDAASHAAQALRRTLHLVAPATSGSKGSADGLSRLMAALADSIVEQLKGLPSTQ